MLAIVCQRMQKSQQCWDLQCIVEKIQLLETMCKAHAYMAQKMLDQKLQTDQKLLGYASATMKQKIC